jgi:hypothetical protein
LTSNQHAEELQENSRTLTTVTLVLLLLCSLSFALYNSNSAYNSDEVWSVKAASLNYSSEMAMLKADVHPPLYFLILHSWIRLFGTGEQTVRSLSGLFYILSVFAVYGLGKELYGSKTALLCATIYLSSPLAIRSAQFARMYTLLALLSIVSTWLYLQFSVRPRDSNRHLLFYVLVNILGTFTHVAFFFVLFGQIVFHFLFYRRARIKRFVTAILLSVAPYLFIWAPILLGQINTSGEGLAWLKKPSFSSVGILLLLYGGSFWLLVPVLFYLWWRSGFESLRRFSKLEIKSLPAWLLAITILTPLLISQVKPIFNARLAIIGLHLFALTIGALIGRRTNFFLTLELIVLTGIGLFFLNPASAPCDNRITAAYLSQSVNDEDAVIFTSLTRLPIDFYLQRAPTIRRPFEISFPAEIDKHPGYEGRIYDLHRRTSIEREAQELIDKLAQTLPPHKGGRIFLFRGLHPDIDSLLDKSLLKHFELLPTQGLKCGEASPYFNEISVYRRRVGPLE